MTQWQIGDVAPDATLTTVTGESVALSTLWQGRGLVITFLRHFG